MKYYLLFINREQEVSNLLVNKKYHEALKIALNLNQPYRTLTIIKGKQISFSLRHILFILFLEILNETNGTDHLKNTLLQFSDDHLSKSHINIYSLLIVDFQIYYFHM